MHTTTVAFTLLSALASAAFAFPHSDNFLAMRNPIPDIGFGQQLQDDDQTNHWVVWEEGKDACPPDTILNVLTSPPCGYEFQLRGGPDIYKFDDCDDNGNPNSVFRNGDFLRSCHLHTSTIHCGSIHDVVKHGKCVAK